MGRTAAVAVESAFTPLGLNLSLGMDGMVGSLLNEAGTSNQLSGINRKGRSPITPEEAVLIQQYLGIQEKNPLAADRSVLDSSRTVLDIIGADTSHPAVIYQAEPDDFKFHPKERYQNRPGSRWIIPVERFGEALPVPDADNLVDLVVNDFNTAVLDMVTIGAMPLVGAGNIIKSIEPAFRILVSKARKGKKISLSDELKTLYENIADQSVMEASPVLSKTLLGMTALTVAFSPIASTLNLKDIKAFGKAANDGLELGHGFSLTPTPDGKPPHVPRWAYLIPGGMMLWGILSACNEATKRPPAVSVSTATHEPTRLAPTEIPKTATFAPTPSATPELALTPSNGSGGPEFIPGSAADLQKLIDLKNFNPATGIDIYKDDGTYTKEYSDAKSALQNQGANVDALEKALKEILKPGQSLKLLYKQEGWAFLAVDGNNLLWSRNTSTGQWADHPNAIRPGFSLDKIGEARPGHKLGMVILGGKPWVIEFKDGSAVRYFDTVTGEFEDFRWDPLIGSENLIGKYNWNGIWQTKVFSDGKLEVSGQETSGTTVFNRALQIIEIKGDSSFGAKFSTQGGIESGLAFVDRDPQGLTNWWDAKQLHIIVNRKPNGYSGLWIGYRDFSKDPVTLLNENSIPAQVNGQDQVEVKFRLGSDEVIVVINGRQLKPVVAKGLLKNAKLIPGIIAGKQTKSIVTEFTMNVPNGGQKNAKLLEAASVVPTAAPTPRPQFTPVPPATKTPEPSKGPRLLTYAEAQNLLSHLEWLGECLSPHQKGGFPDMETASGWKYFRKGIASANGTVITYPDGKSFDVAGAKRTVFWVFPQVYTPGSIEVIHVTSISPKLIVPYLGPGDYAQIDISPDGKVDGLVVLCYYK